MKTRAKTVREGEYLGPIDWDYDFRSHDWDHKGSTNPKVVERGIEFLKTLEGNEDDYLATTDGGWPKIGYGQVLKVGMYDGWPYWRPVPSVLVSGTYGAEWHSFTSISAIKEKS